MTSRPHRRIADRLAAAGCVAADEEATELVAAAPDPETLESFVRRREAGEPVPHITGVLRFCGHDVLVGPGVFVPRIQSEELARRAAASLRDEGTAADLCTGAGAVAGHLLRAVPGARVVGVDSDANAIRQARANGVPCLLGDLDAPLRSATFDVVTAVAPYVPTSELRTLPRDVLRYEPRSAIDGGADGLDVVRRVVAGAARILRPGGWLFTEIGADQDAALASTLEKFGFDQWLAWRDEDGDLRGVAAQR